MRESMTNGKVTGIVKGLPREAWVCGTVIVSLEIVAVAVNIDLGRPTAQFVSFLATINGILITAVTLMFQTHKTAATAKTNQDKIGNLSEGVDALRNGEMDNKFRETLGEVLPELIGHILDARGVPIREPMAKTPTTGVGSGHEPTHTPTDSPR